MRLEDVDEDVMTQGTNYEPTNESKDVDLDVEVDDATDDKHVKKSFGNKIILIVGGVIIIALAGVIGVVAMKKQQEKKEAEILARMEEEEPAFAYTSDEIQELRDNGYTGDEIEQFEIDEIPAQRKIDDAEQRRKEKYDAEIKPYFDGASDKYKELEQYTWLAGDPISFDINLVDSEWYDKNTTLNLDYDKVPARGVQCFLRVHLKEATADSEPLYMFMTVTPQRYYELPEHGNIVVYIQYTVTDQGTVVTSLEEQRVADK